jgi:hypothetical protein
MTAHDLAPPPRIMNHRLLVNPGTAQAWEIVLKPGVNRLGRNEDNDFPIPHGSVSGHHCEVVVAADGVTLRDLGSTNGSFVNRAPVREARLESGQHVQLGAVDMVFQAAAASSSVAAAPPLSAPSVRVVATGATTGSPAVRIVLPQAAPSTPPTPPPPPPPPAASQGGRLKFSGLPAPAAVPASVAAEAEAVGAEPPLVPPVPVPVSGDEFCKFHGKIPARFYCPRCAKYYCDMCVATRSTSSGTAKTCRACGSGVTPLAVHAARPGSRSFFGALPGAFIYPFRGMGVVVLILATIAFSALGFISAGLLAILVKIVFYGFVFLFMQNIIHTTTADEKEPLGFPEADDLFGAAFQLAATIVVSFGLAIALIVARIMDVEVPVGAIVASIILGCFYFPMAFLAVAMKDSVMAANPLVVIPTILRMPVEYFVTAVLLVGVYGVRQLGDVLSSVAGSVSLTTKDMSTLLLALSAKAGLAFFNVYLLTVTMRVLGLLYNTRKDKFGWFEH